MVTPIGWWLGYSNNTVQSLHMCRCRCRRWQESVRWWLGLFCRGIPSDLHRICSVCVAKAFPVIYVIRPAQLDCSRDRTQRNRGIPLPIPLCADRRATEIWIKYHNIIIKLTSLVFTLYYTGPTYLLFVSSSSTIYMVLFFLSSFVSFQAYPMKGVEFTRCISYFSCFCSYYKRLLCCGSIVWVKSSRLCKGITTFNFVWFLSYAIVLCCIGSCLYLCLCRVDWYPRNNKPRNQQRDGYNHDLPFCLVSVLFYCTVLNWILFVFVFVWCRLVPSKQHAKESSSETGTMATATM